ncbi:Ger(x)C family spore germination protein [Metabacillus sp. B2-18]|uniref:Ger(x)C family spore germination protein n=1 Tax=Metabacillus sp. B2-18 TaxID=2897333 RepID=UPI001E2D2FB7|nr:Ger(x)C family spore germination protein [Metabacillus sp. B2-18]UGB32096.1 Ger(x)C family spore germination protein [Metabacillus sp. B2-18]
MVTRKMICLLCICVLLLTGCWDRVEVNDLAFVVSTGFDKVGDNQFRVSVQVPLPGAMSESSGGGGGTGGGGPYYVDSGIGRNVRESNDDLQERMSRELYFAHRRIIIFGEELARFGFKKSLDVVLEQPQSRLSAYVLLTKGEAINVLNATPHLEMLPAEAMREMAKSGFGITVKDVLMDISRPGKDTFIPIVETTETQNANSKDKKQEVKMSGFGILKKDELKFFTTKEEAWGLRWLLEKANGNNYTFVVGEKEELNVNIIKSKVKTNYKSNGGKPSFTLTIKVESNMMQNEPNLKLAEQEVYSSAIKDMKKQIKSEVLSLINHGREEGIDIFGFGWYLYLHHNDEWEKWKDDWEKILKDADIEIKVDAEIKRTINSGINIKE